MRGHCRPHNAELAELAELAGEIAKTRGSDWSSVRTDGGWLDRLVSHSFVNHHHHRDPREISIKFPQIFSFHLKSAGAFEAAADFLSMSPQYFVE